MIILTDKKRTGWVCLDLLVHFFRWISNLGLRCNPSDTVQQLSHTCCCADVDLKSGLLSMKRLCTSAGLAWGGCCSCWLHGAAMRAECRRRRESLKAERTCNNLVYGFSCSSWWEAVHSLADSHVFSVCSIGIRERIQMYIIHAKGLCSYFMVTY